MIKRLQLVLPLFILAMMLGGCPYTSKVPLEAPSITVFDSFLGEWTKKNGKAIYTVSKRNDTTYFIKKKDESGETIYIGYLSILGEDVFLNLYEEGSTSPDYYFYKTLANKDFTKVILVPVTEGIDEKFKTSAELKAFFEKYKNLSFFYASDLDEEEYDRK